MTLDQKRATLVVVVQDIAITLIRQIKDAQDEAALAEVAQRIAKLPALETPTHIDPHGERE